MADPISYVVNFASNVENSISSAFRWIVLFLNQVQLIFEHVGFWFAVLTFFLLLALCMYLPIKLYPYWIRAKAIYYKFFERIERSYNKDR